MTERQTGTSFFKSLQHRARVGIENFSDKLLTNIFGYSVLDKKYPDPRPAVNQEHADIRYNMEAAAIIKEAQIKSKIDALAVASTAIIASYSEWNYKSRMYNFVSDKAFNLAREMGATEDEILEVIHKAQISGSTLGSRDI